MENLLPMFEKENDRSYSMDRLSLRKNARGQKPFLLWQDSWANPNVILLHTTYEYF